MFIQILHLLTNYIVNRFPNFCMTSGQDIMFIKLPYISSNVGKRCIPRIPNVVIRVRKALLLYAFRATQIEQGPYQWM